MSAARPPAFTATWIENWPPPVQTLSFRQSGLQLTMEQAHALGVRNAIHPQVFVPQSPSILAELARNLDSMFPSFADGAFVRLGSRSPKDTPQGVLTGCRATQGSEAVALLTSGSERVAYDLRRALQADYRPWIFLREWMSIPWPEEFRGFLRAGEVVGATQYFDGEALPADREESLIAAARRVLPRIGSRLASSLGSLDCTFDVWVPPTGESYARLIEINPWGEPTGSGLFAWAGDDFDRTLRWRTRRGTRALALRPPDEQ